MKKIALAGATAFAVLAVPVLAQQTPQRPAQQPMTRAAVQQAVASQFARADANRDGFVTKDEVDAVKREARAERQAKRAERRGDRFARLDVNKDGQISRTEFSARPERADRGERRAKRAERRADRAERRHDRREAALAGRFGRTIERADADEDGRISLAEATARPLARFDRVDANRDGTLTREERDAARALRQQRRADRG